MRWDKSIVLTKLYWWYEILRRCNCPNNRIIILGWYSIMVMCNRWIIPSTRLLALYSQRFERNDLIGNYWQPGNDMCSRKFMLMPRLVRGELTICENWIWLTCSLVSSKGVAWPLKGKYKYMYISTCRASSGCYNSSS